MARILFTSRTGGIGSPPYLSFNLGQHVADDPKVVAKNRHSLLSEFSVDSIFYMDQVHGIDIFEVTSETKATPIADAIFTREKNVALAVQVADCIPLLLASSSMVAAVHVGRKGLAGGIIEKVLDLFHEASDIQVKADIGPAICGNCYEVDLETYESVIALVPETATSSQRHHLDLINGAKSILNRNGVAVRDWGICTKENQNYFSYRRDGVTGRQAGVIAL
jgi:YfiH family protein